jgi:hypothetical protein
LIFCFFQYQVMGLIKLIWLWNIKLNNLFFLILKQVI